LFYEKAGGGAMPAKIETQLGNIEIAPEVFANLVGSAATSCYGVVGMANRNSTDGIVSLLKRDAMDKGVKVNITGQELDIDLHIIVEYGVNIKVISQSIVNRVKYFLESTTGFDVGAVNIYVDSLRIDA
jgi:uncharacterized alkaline shock family protein YloU